MYKKISWKWLTVIAGVTALAVALTMGVCFSQSEETACAPGFSYGKFVRLSNDVVASPFGDIFQLPEDSESLYDSAFLSPNGETMLCSGDAGRLTVFSRYGAHVLEQPMTDWSILSTVNVSFYGEVVYFFAEEQSDRDVAALWYYDVAQGASTQITSFSDVLFNGVVSPHGEYFAIMDGDNTIHIYNKDKEMKTWPGTPDTALYFLTDDGVLFFGDSDLQSLYGEEQISYTTTKNEFKNVLFNKDGTEMIVNRQDDISMLYQVQQGVPTQTVPFYGTGDLAVMHPTMMTADLTASVIVPSESTLKCRMNTNCFVYDVDSFRELNLVNEATGERAKLTEDNELIYQENSAAMERMLATSGKYIMYIDANGDYYYTDTDDETGEYKLLWEASKCDVQEVLYITGQKSFYYMDSELNVHYAKANKDTVIVKGEQWNRVAWYYTIEDTTDTLYFMDDGVMYCCREGGSVRKIVDCKKIFPDYEYERMSNENAAGVYCYGETEAGDITGFCRVYADGSYQLIEAE